MNEKPIGGITKSEQLRKYLDQLQRTQIMLLDMLRCKELTQREYDELIDGSQRAYHQFLRDLKETGQPLCTETGNHDLMFESGDDPNGYMVCRKCGIRYFSR